MMDINHRTSEEIKEVPNVGYLFYKDYYNIDGEYFLHPKNYKFPLGDKKGIGTYETTFFKKKNREIENQKFWKASAAFMQVADEEMGFRLYTQYPGLITGTGTDHATDSKNEYKLGLTFDYTTGLPLIPGSSVKGLLRSAFPNSVDSTKDQKQSSEEIEKLKIYQANRRAYILQLLRSEAINFSVEDQQNKINKIKEAEGVTSLGEYDIVDLIEYSIFAGQTIGKDEDGKPALQSRSSYSRDIFYDAYINQSHHKEGKYLASDFLAPHHPEVYKDPNPIQFLKILPQVEFQFQFKLQEGPFLSVAQKKALFKRIILDLGIGAKTNVGYGHLSEQLPPENIEVEVENNNQGRHSGGGRNTDRRNKRSSTEETKKSLMIPNEDIAKGHKVYGLINKEPNGNRLDFEVLIEGYPKSGNTLTEEARFMRVNDIVELAVNKVKEDKTYTFKFVKKYDPREPNRNRRR